MDARGADQAAPEPEELVVPAEEREGTSERQAGAVGSGGGARRRVSQAVRELEALRAITDTALAILSTDELLERLLDRIRAILGGELATILLVDDADPGQLVVCAASGSQEEVEQEVRIPLGRGIAGRIALQGQAAVVDDLTTAEVYSPLLRRTVRSLVGAPLRVEGRTLGVVHIGSKQVHYFTADDGRVLQLVADRIALALDRARLFEAERRAHVAAEAARARLQTVLDISDVALEHPDLDGLLRTLLARIRTAMHADNVAILLVTEDGEHLTIHTAQGGEERVAGQVRIPIGHGVAGRIAATRQPLVIDDLSTVEVANPFLREHETSLMGVPLLVDRASWASYMWIPSIRATSRRRRCGCSSWWPTASPWRSTAHSPMRRGRRRSGWRRSARVNSRRSSRRLTKAS